MSGITSINKDKLVIRPVAGRIGAEISGVKLSSNLDQHVIDAIYDAFLQYKVIFFRNQSHMDDLQHEEFAQRFGDPIKHPTVDAHSGTKFTLELDSHTGIRANSWHTDVTFMDAYPKASILRAVVVPPTGGDTVWANTEAAYGDLPGVLKTLVDNIWAEHSNNFDFKTIFPTLKNRGDAPLPTEKRRIFTTHHPVVRVHPETKKRSLVLGLFVKRIIEFKRKESEQMFNLLQDYVTSLENTVRWRWQAGDVVMWDNRATQHYALDDYGSQERIMRRVTLEGDVPVSIDGKTSRMTCTQVD